MSNMVSTPFIMTESEAPMDVSAGGKISTQFQFDAGVPEAILGFDIVTGPDSEAAPEWDVTLYDSTNTELWSNCYHTDEVEIALPGSKAKMLRLEVTCPKGARYGDEVTVTVSHGDHSMSFKAVAKQSIMVLKTQMDQERSVTDSMVSKASVGEKDIYAIFSPVGLRGYIFVEGMNTDRVREKARDIRRARSFVDGETSIEEISHYLVPVSAVIGIVEGDIVELINGPFKGEIARVQQIDHNKEEITVELVEAMVPIPVTVKGDSVRVIEKER